jgi:ATP-dependent protease HslVU (ClpYQ) peptidase subunit
MTLVVGVAENGKVLIGADSANSWGNDTARSQVCRNSKVFRVGNLLIGSAGSGRVQNVLRYVSFPKHPRGMTNFEYVAHLAAEAVRKAMIEAGAVDRHEGNAEEMTGNSSVLIGYRGGLYRMDSDFSVDEAADDFDAVGTGSPYALTVLEVTGEKPAAERLRLALKATEKNCWSVRRPFRIEVL